MTASHEQLESFASISWARPYLTSPDWVARPHKRGCTKVEDTNVFCKDTIRAFNGIQHWLELYETPTSGNKLKRVVTLCKFGTGLNGFPGIVHGGAVLTILDEALAAIMVGNKILEGDPQWTQPQNWAEVLKEATSPEEVLRGNWLTVKMDVRFLKPVLCPGTVGVEVHVVEYRERKMILKAVMKDGKGTPLAQVDGVYVLMGGKAKL